jgi:hypothetical protein
MVKSGVFLGIPFDWRIPTWQRFRERLWNPADRRVLVPKVFGWGWDINFYELLRRVRILPR